MTSQKLVFVPPGHEFTCTETWGNPGPASYTLHYMHQSGQSVSRYGERSWDVQEIGNFSLVCEVRYTHPVCPGHSAVCFENISSVAFG